MSKYYAVVRSTDHLAHYGVLGMKWGVRKKRPVSNETLFVSGSSKTQDKTSPYYRRKLPKYVKKQLKQSMKKGDKIIVGDAPGIDRQTQDYLKKKRYDNVEIYGPGTQVRYNANPKWKTNPINDTKHEVGSPEWLAKKDEAMSKNATKGLAVILDKGSGATRNNIRRLQDQKKRVRIYELAKPRKGLINIRGMQNPADQEVLYYFESDPKKRHGKGYDFNGRNFAAVYRGMKHTRPHYKL